MSRIKPRGRPAKTSENTAANAQAAARRPALNLRRQKVTPVVPIGPVRSGRRAWTLRALFTRESPRTHRGRAVDGRPRRAGRSRGVDRTNERVRHLKAKSPTNEGVSPRNHFAADNQWGRSPRSSASTSPMFSTQQTHFAPAADPEKDPVAALGLLASTPLLDRRAQPSPPPRYRSLSKPNSPQKEKTDQWEGV